MTERAWPKPSDVNRVIARLQSDAGFKSLLLRDANAALISCGIEIPRGVTVKVHENTPTTANFVLPTPSRTEELTDESLEAVAGGITIHAPTKG